MHNGLRHVPKLLRDVLLFHDLGAFPQAILSQEAYGVCNFTVIELIILLRGERSVEGVIRLTDHDASFAFPNGVTKVCRGGARVAVTQKR